jgi:sulfotransferase family protein
MNLMELACQQQRQQVLSRMIALIDEASGSAASRSSDAPLMPDEVIVVASSSRSGSSFFAELLKRSDRYCHLAGEVNPFLRLVGLSWPESGMRSDELLPEHSSGQAADAFKRLLWYEAGFETEDALEAADHAFITRLRIRLLLQWPSEDFSYDEIHQAVNTSLSQLCQATGRSFNWATDLQQFYASLLAQLRSQHPAIHPYYYDIDPLTIERVFSDLPKPEGPPSHSILEEPPFILVRPWSSWDLGASRRRTLVIKTPSNAYRLYFLHRLFPRAKFRVLHLTRNPAASINGLMDGWRHCGFHSHYIGPSLQIQGYSRPDNRDSGWWKFDLPPSWEERQSATLAEVCSFQWYSANQSILEFAENTGVDYLRIRYEDLLTDFARHPADLQALRRWLGNHEFLAEKSGTIPFVMATHIPQPRRWRRNAAALGSALRDAQVSQVANRLGYCNENDWL